MTMPFINEGANKVAHAIAVYITWITINYVRFGRSITPPCRPYWDIRCPDKAAITSCKRNVELDLFSTIDVRPEDKICTFITIDICYPCMGLSNGKST